MASNPLSYMRRDEFQARLKVAYKFFLNFSISQFFNSNIFLNEIYVFSFLMSVWQHHHMFDERLIHPQNTATANVIACLCGNKIRKIFSSSSWLFRFCRAIFSELLLSLGMQIGLICFLISKFLGNLYLD